jgi:hypothetical protein
MLVPDSWRCPVADPTERNPSYCRHCGSPVEWHPVDVCYECAHLVCFHGADTEGCGRINAAGWCECRQTFGRANAEHVRYWRFGVQQ